MVRVAFLASGSGAAARAVITAAQAGQLDVAPVLLVSNRREAPALAFAAEHGVPVGCIPTKADPGAADAELCEALGAAGAGLVVLSGYLRKLGPLTLGRFRGRVLNIHPGPLPDFGGEGMYGRAVHDAVLAAGVAESCICIHVVDGDYDRGPVIARRKVAIHAGDTPESLEARVRGQEPEFFVETLRRVVSGELILDNWTPDPPASICLNFR